MKHRGRQKAVKAGVGTVGSHSIDSAPKHMSDYAATRPPHPPPHTHTTRMYACMLGTQTPYMLDKLDLVGLPNFAAGAMEK